MPNAERTPHIQGRVDDFKLPSLDGKDVALGREIARPGRRGAVVLFWSSICSHCVRYDPYLNEFRERFPMLALLVIASRQNEDARRLRSAASERGLNFPLLHDADRTVARGWQVEQTPRAFLVAPDGRIHYRGAIDNFTDPRDPDHEPYLDHAIEDFLAGRPARRAETPSFGCPIESVYYDLP